MPKIFAADATSQFEVQSPESVMGKYWRSLNVRPSYRLHPRDLTQEIDRLQALGFQGWRVDLFPWSKLIANIETLEFNEEELQWRLRALIYAYKQKFQIILTLWHWDYPVGLEKGWSDLKTKQVFQKYVLKLFQRLQLELQKHDLELTDIISTIGILNEPMVNSGQAYILRNLIPGIFNPLRYIKAVLHMAGATRYLYQNLKQDYPELNISVSINVAAYEKRLPKYSQLKTKFPYMPVQNVVPLGSSLTQKGHFVLRSVYNFIYAAFLKITTLLTKYYDRKLFLELLKSFGGIEPDTILVNYWHSWIFNCNNNCREDLWLSDYGWHLDPLGLSQVLYDLSRIYPDKAITITELGAHLYGERDLEKAEYLEQCLQQIKQAQNNGVNVETVCWWGVVDNLEWGHHAPSPSGFYGVDDPPTYKPYLRHSGKLAQEAIARY